MSPVTRTAPALGVSSPAISRSRVDFPDPLTPMRPVLPGPTASWNRSRTEVPSGQEKESAVQEIWVDEWVDIRVSRLLRKGWGQRVETPQGTEKALFREDSSNTEVTRGARRCGHCTARCLKTSVAQCPTPINDDRARENITVAPAGPQSDLPRRVVRGRARHSDGRTAGRRPQAEIMGDVARSRRPVATFARCWSMS